MQNKWKILSAILTVLLVVVMIVNSKQYDDLMEVCQEYQDDWQKSSEKYQSVIDSWEKSYDELQTEYGKALAENDKLKSEKSSYSLEEVMLLAKTVRAEAGDSSNHSDSQIGVASVIMNRVADSRFPNSIKEVVYQKVGNIPQFSVAYNGALDSAEVDSGTLSNVYLVLSEGSQLPSDVLYFYSSSVKENWVNTLETYSVCQGTVFAKGE